MILLLTLLLLTSCAKTEIVGMPETPETWDTLPAKRPKPLSQAQPQPKDTTETPDTIRVPIGFNPTVADWDELTENTTP